jgi:putative FmdB family regulatory protein
MPIYEYQCRKCGHEFEREQRIVEDPIKKCPACKSNQAKRLISKTSFVLKGSGWYSDLYSSAKPAKDGGSDDSGSGESKPEGKSEGKSETKSDSKTESKSDAKGKKKKSAA